jgi:galactose mutarotase-like enzyme
MTRAGMLGWSLCHRRREVVAHPVSLREYVETGEPTGIALLHPWANRLSSPEYEIAGRRVRLDTGAPNVHTDGNGLPIHGLVAGSPRWEVVDHEPSRLHARLDFAAARELMEGFPFPHVVEMAAQLSDEHLAIDTELVPTGDDPVPVAFGYHPYVRVPGAPRERWIAELPVSSRMVLDERMLPTGRSEPVRIDPAPLGERTFDDAFDGVGPGAEFAISAAGRRVAVRWVEGYRFAQVYAPPGGQFISFEPMTAPVNPFASDRTLLAPPGARYRASFEIAVSAL